MQAGRAMKKIFLHPAADVMAYFPFVMATGIVSLAALQQHWEGTARFLFDLNRAGYFVLGVLTVIAVLRGPLGFAAAMTVPSKAPGMFTIVAGTGILGSQAVILDGNFAAGTAFLFVGLFFWFALTYSFFTGVIVRSDKTGGEDLLGGEWLIYVVGTQSLAILTALLVPWAGQWRSAALAAAVCLHLWGNALYFLLIVLIARRMLFLPLLPEELTPPYWITMGASAISTLAGAELILHAGPESIVRDILPALKGMTLLFWSVSTWWLPLLVILNIWRYLGKRYPVMYDVQHWSMVFPIGMYAACTFQLGEAAGLAFMAAISRFMVPIALAAWAVVFLGMVVRAFRRRGP